MRVIADLEIADHWADGWHDRARERNLAMEASWGTRITAQEGPTRTRWAPKPFVGKDPAGTAHAWDPHKQDSTTWKDVKTRRQDFTKPLSPEDTSATDEETEQYLSELGVPDSSVTRPPERRVERPPTLTEIDLQHMGDRGQKNIEAVLALATPEEIDYWRNWYKIAHREAVMLARKHGVDLMTAAAVIAVLSPHELWQANLELADAALAGNWDDVGTLIPSREKAYSIIHDRDFSAIRGEKVYPFFLSMYDPEKFQDEVVVDTHAAAIWLGQRVGKVPSINDAVRAKMSEDYRKAAAKFGLKPQEAQACAWVVWRQIPVPKTAMTDSSKTARPGAMRVAADEVATKLPWSSKRRKGDDLFARVPEGYWDVVHSLTGEGWVVYTPARERIPGFASRDEAQAHAEMLAGVKKTRVAVRGGDIGMREMERWNTSDRPYALLSAVQGGSLSERKERHAQLLQELQRLGLKHEDVRGQWEEASSGKMRAEPSLWVKDIDLQTALALGRKYDQDAIIWKSPDGVVGMYNLRDGTVRVPSKDNAPAFGAESVSTGPKGPKVEGLPNPSDQFARAKSMSFGVNYDFGDDKSVLPWDGKTPVSRRQVEQHYGPADTEKAATRVAASVLAWAHPTPTTWDAGPYAIIFLAGGPSEFGGPDREDSYAAYFRDARGRSLGAFGTLEEAQARCEQHVQRSERRIDKLDAV